jgi:hypothetical protein
MVKNASRNRKFLLEEKAYFRNTEKKETSNRIWSSGKGKWL